MRSRLLRVLTFGILVCGYIGPAHAECVGEPGYQVCSDSTTDSNGDIHARSYDTEGNSYSVDTNTTHDADGGTTISSSDSEGNSYNVRSWSDSSGIHSMDSMGNECTITPSGTMIGCGQ